MRLALKLPTDWAEQRKLLGRLAEILEAIEAASELELWAEQSAEEVVEFGQLTVPKGHRGDAGNLQADYRQGPGHLGRRSREG